MPRAESHGFRLCSTRDSRIRSPGRQGTRPGTNRHQALDLLLGGPARPPDVAELIRQVNESNEAVADHGVRARLATHTPAGSQQVASSGLKPRPASSGEIDKIIQPAGPALALSLPRQVVSRCGHGSAWTEWPATSLLEVLHGQPGREAGAGRALPGRARCRRGAGARPSPAPPAAAPGCAAATVSRSSSRRWASSGKNPAVIGAAARRDLGGGWGGPTSPPRSIVPFCHRALRIAEDARRHGGPAGRPSPPGGPPGPPGRPQSGMQWYGIA